MKDSKDSKKSLLGDLEKIQKLLNSEASSKETDQSGAPDIPLLSDVVSGQSDAKVDDQNSAAPAEKKGKPKNNNPFIPYEAIDRLNKERSSMRNFAAEVMQAAQQGIEKPPIDGFDLFKYSKNAPKPEVKTETQLDSLSPTEPETPPGIQSKPVAAVIKLPSDTEIQSLVDEVMDEYRPIMEKALRKSLTEFIKQSLKDAPSDE